MRNHLSSPDKNKVDTEVEEGEITSEDEAEKMRRKKEKLRSEKRQRIVSISDHSNTETAVSVNGVKEVNYRSYHTFRSWFKFVGGSTKPVLFLIAIYIFPLIVIIIIYNYL